MLHIAVAGNSSLHLRRERHTHRAYSTTCARNFAFVGEIKAQWAATLSNKKLSRKFFIWEEEQRWL